MQTSKKKKKKIKYLNPQIVNSIDEYSSPVLRWDYPLILGHTLFLLKPSTVAESAEGQTAPSRSRESDESGKSGGWEEPQQ